LKINLSKYKPHFSHVSVGLLLIILCITLFANPRSQLGDINNDGEVNVADIVLMVDIILTDGIEYGDYELWASDVNLDETIDVVDIVLMIPVILEFDNCEEDYSPCIDNFSMCCLDTTSHYVSWTIDTLGTPGTYSTLYDIEIIDENNIWVVGEIHTEDTDQFDSTGTWVNPYNAANWNGSEWELVTIIPEGYLWGMYTSVFAFNENDIWFGATILVHWDGTQYIPYGSQQNFPTGMGYTKKIWGTEEGLFVIYNNGGIVNYDGESFQQMDSGTTVHLKSISGTGIDNVWVSGDNLDSGENLHTLLHYDGSNWNTIIETSATNNYEEGMISGVLECVYAHQPDSVFILTHLGLYISADTTQGEGELLSGGQTWEAVMRYISGNHRNDIFFSGALNTIWHYNGSTFHQYDDFSYMGGIWGQSIKGDMIAFCGFLTNYSTGFILIGERN